MATSHRDAIQKAMMVHIKDITEHNANGMYPVFDPDSKTVVQLKLTGFHDSVELKGRSTPYFVSCADFTAEDGTLYDLDFLRSTGMPKRMTNGFIPWGIRCFAKNRDRNPFRSEDPHESDGLTKKTREGREGETSCEHNLGSEQGS